MKKLVILAALCCAAIVAQAAQVSITGMADYEDSSDSYTGTVSLYMVGSDSEMGSFKVNEGRGSGVFTLANGYTYYLATMETVGVYQYTFKSEEITVSSTSRPLTFTSGSWTTESVPEPTSGLLMLLGLAGLALKRKRA